MLFLKTLKTYSLILKKIHSFNSVQYPHYADLWVIEVFSLDEAYKTWMSIGCDDYLYTDKISYFINGHSGMPLSPSVSVLIS